MSGPPAQPARSPCGGPVRLSRRYLLKAAGAGLCGLSLPRLLQADARRAGTGLRPTADACILIFLTGGPSHLDMWDMKPEAPAEVRGPFKPVATTVPGVRMCEHLPRLARQMHRCALVRSVTHSVNNNHGSAVYTALTGHDRGDSNAATGAGPDDYPAVGSVAALCRPPTTPTAPFVAMPFLTRDGAGGPVVPGFFGGWLGRAYDPLFVLGDPGGPGCQMPGLAPTPDTPAGRLAARQALLARLQGTPGGPRAGGVAEMNMFQAKAVDLLTAPRALRAFDLEREPAAVRDRYGRNACGQSVLLARRLIEAGTRVAAVTWASESNAAWDTHLHNFTRLKGELLPQLDAAVPSLLDDLAERGLLGRTLVAVLGEFGRSPKVNADAGRDHWNFCYTLMLAGGGVRGGVVHGASDRIGARPGSSPVSPADVIATVYHCLGIPADTELRDRSRRPFQLVPWGNPVRPVLG